MSSPFRLFGLLAEGALLLALTWTFGCTTDPSCADLSTTWASNGETFFGDYCTSCHSSSLSGADRNDAPSSLNYDTYGDLTDAGLNATASQIDGGPMPPSSWPQPSSAEIDTLVTWLDCGAPE